MKAGQILLSITMGLFPVFSNAQAAWSWELENVPEEGIKDITFPMSMKGSAHEQHYYYANQFPFVGNKDIGYTGLQPQADADNGTSQIRGVFSNFIEGATTDDDLCSEGADGGPGISCGLVFAGDYDHVYNMVIHNTGDTTWTGTAVNKNTGEEHHIGSYTLPSDTKGISGGHMGFVEDYIGVDECSYMPKGGVIAGDPFSESAQDVNGHIGEPEESGTCAGAEANWSAKRTDGEDGWVMTLGY